MSERATERDGEHVTAIKSDETGRWVRIPDGVDGVRAYQLLRAASTDAPSEERPDDLSNCRCGPLKPVGSHIRACPLSDRAPTDEAPEREDGVELDGRHFAALDAAIAMCEGECLSADTDDSRTLYAHRARLLSEVDGWLGRHLRQPEPTREGGGEPPPPPPPDDIDPHVGLGEAGPSEGW